MPLDRIEDAIEGEGCHPRERMMAWGSPPTGRVSAQTRRGR
jgi:hypothetical protein